MPPRAKSKAKSAAKGKGKAAHKATAKAIARRRAKRLRLVVRNANARQRMRKDAVSSLNALATELELERVQVQLKCLVASEPKVERLIRTLEPRCQTDVLAQRLRDAVKLWKDNQGALSQPMTEEDANPMPAESNTDDTDDSDVRYLPRHKVLQAGYTLKSKAFMLTFNSDTFNAETWVTFESWVKKKRKEFGARAWAACIEISVHAEATQHGTRHHLHCYFFWTDGVGLFRRNLDDLMFNGVKPRVDKCTAQKKVTPRTAACHGLWYVTVKKTGTLQSSTNYEPGVAYKPLRAWLDGIYDEGKVSHRRYMDLTKQFPLGYAARKRDCEELLREEHQSMVAALIKKECDDLKAAGFWKTPRPFQEVELFVAAHTGQARDRRPLLAIIGGTQTGKSLLAASVLQKLAEWHGLPGFLEITVEEDGNFDMSNFRVDKDSGALLDGVGDVEVLRKARETLQGRPKVIKGGRSATMVYAYSYTLCRRAVVATFDLSARNLHLFKCDHWLKDPRNVIQLHLTSPAWETGEAASSERMSREEQMRSWTVADTGRFLQEQDLAGPAEVARMSGVNGADLLEASLEQLSTEIRLTPFAARKVAAARDAFLRE